jgi:hypothetical protein
MDVWKLIGATFVQIGLFCHFSDFNEVGVSFQHAPKHFSQTSTPKSPKKKEKTEHIHSKMTAKLVGLF